MTPVELYLSGKTVSTSLPDQLQILLPSFKVIQDTQPYPYVPNALYIGPNQPSLRKKLHSNHQNVVQVTKNGEIQLETPSQWVSLALINHSRKLTERQAVILDALSLDDSKEIIQSALILGKVTGLPTDENVSIYELFQTLPGPQTELIRTLLTLLEHQPTPIIESSLLTMILRVKDLEEQEVSPKYRKLLEQTAMKIRKNIPHAGPHLHS